MINLKEMKKIILIITVILAFACNTEVDQTARKINYNRDMCANCLMGITDQKYTAQAINEYGEVIWFDDLGCFIEYEKSDAWKIWGGVNARVWIGDCETEKWIDAFQAFYRFGDRTPMGYGYGALKTNSADSLFDYQTTVKRINSGETMREKFIKSKKMMMHGMSDSTKIMDTTMMTK